MSFVVTFRIKNASWSKESRDLRIWPTDTGDDDQNSKPIQVLIGADIAGKLLTGRRHILQCGLVAVKTYLGWTIMGKVPNTEACKDAADFVISMFILDENDSKLWNLDALIKDPIEKSLKEREREVHEAFLKTIQLNKDGHYKVQPWLQNHPAINDNRELAYKRLVAITKKLRAEELFNEYDAVFDEWKTEGIIEEVPIGEVDN